jgi:hypothetical protein
MYRFTSDQIDLGELRERLRKMNDVELLAFGKAARYMCSPAANLGKSPREPFVIQLEEARAEWRRRSGPRSLEDPRFRYSPRRFTDCVDRPFV